MEVVKEVAIFIIAIFAVFEIPSEIRKGNLEGRGEGLGWVLLALISFCLLGIVII